MVIYLSLINVLSFILMALDKYRAVKNKSRISEVTFYLLTFLCGIVGIILGGLVFSHKTRKRSFQIKVIGITIVQVVLIYVFREVFKI